MSSHKKSSRKVDMAGKANTHRYVAGRHNADPQVRVVVMVCFIINFHTWGMNSVSFSVSNRPKGFNTDSHIRLMLYS